ncbi:MAG: hypothetical protein EZS28_046891, partial [Streblomastix strix]
NANYFNLAANSVNSHLNSEIGSHMLGAQVIARSDTANKDVIRREEDNQLLSSSPLETGQ